MTIDKRNKDIPLFEVTIQEHELGNWKWRAVYRVAGQNRRTIASGYSSSAAGAALAARDAVAVKEYELSSDD